MLKVLKAGAAVATVSTVLAVSLLTGPAANAATSHKVDNGNKHLTVAVKVVGHTDKFFLDAASKRGVAVQFKHLSTSKTYMAAKYTVSLKHGGKVLYRTTTSTYRALDTNVQVQLASAKYKNDTAVKKVIKRTLALSESAAKADLNKTLDKVAVEYVGKLAPSIVDVINNQVKANPTASWADLGIDPSQLDSFSPESGISIKIAGTPQDYTLTVSGKYTDASLVYTSTTNSYQRINWISLGALDKAFSL